MNATAGGRGPRGQILAVVAIGMVAFVGIVGLVIDGGLAFVARREAQNAADLAASAAAQVVALRGAGADVGQDVIDVVDGLLAQNADAAPACTAQQVTDCYTAKYVDANGSPIRPVDGTTVIPESALGVQVTLARRYETIFMTVFGFDQVDVVASGTARASGYTGAFGGSPGGSNPSRTADVLPIGITLNAQLWRDHACPGDPLAYSCSPVDLELSLEGRDHTGDPGQFTWLSWDSTQDGTGYLCSLLRSARSPRYSIAPNTSRAIHGNIEVVADPCIGNAIRGHVTSGEVVYVAVISPGPPQGGSCGSPAGHCFPNGRRFPAPGVGTGGASTRYNVIGFVGFKPTDCGPCDGRLTGFFRPVVLPGPTGVEPTSNGVPGHPAVIQLVD